MVVYGEGRYALRRARRPAAAAAVGRRAGGRRLREPLPAPAAAPWRWELVPEDARLDPRSTYAASKLAQEHYASAWARQAGAGAVALRYHNVYGPGMPRDTPYSGVAAMFRSSLERGERPQVFEDGGQVRDFVHVDDVARANVAALEQVVAEPVPRYAAYNVCSGRPVTHPRRRDAGSRRAPVARLEPEVTGGFRAGDVRHVVASPELAARELGFTAQISPEDGLADVRHRAVAGLSLTRSCRAGAAPAAR